MIRVNLSNSTLEGTVVTFQSNFASRRKVFDRADSSPIRSSREVLLCTPWQGTTCRGRDELSRRRRSCVVPQDGNEESKIATTSPYFHPFQRPSPCRMTGQHAEKGHVLSIAQHCILPFSYCTMTMLTHQAYIKKHGPRVRYSKCRMPCWTTLFKHY